MSDRGQNYVSKSTKPETFYSDIRCFRAHKCETCATRKRVLSSLAMASISAQIDSSSSALVAPAAVIAGAASLRVSSQKRLLSPRRKVGSDKEMSTKEKPASRNKTRELETDLRVDTLLGIESATDFKETTIRLRRRLGANAAWVKVFANKNAAGFE
jgi:hypothetical protein